MTHEIVIGLGFGDEGKGAAVDWLCATRDVKAVIRFNGGAQAAHNVVQPDGRHHTFAQFGSGTFHGVPTYLSQFMLVNPLNLANEAAHLEEVGVENPYDLLTVSEDALVTTRLHVAANRMRSETLGHGSTGQGIGETREYSLRYPADAIRMRDLKPGNSRVLGDKIIELGHYYQAQFGPEFLTEKIKQSPYEIMTELRWHAQRIHIARSSYINEFLDSGDCVFEGAQGVLLDEDFGFHPHTTWTKTTQANARTLLAGREARVYGVTRTYQTRHGNGPLPTEGHGLLYAPEPHNNASGYAGVWRKGALDLTLLNYAVRANGGVDEIIVSHCDYAEEHFENHEICWGYFDYDSQDLINEIPLPHTRVEQEALTRALSFVRSLGYDMTRMIDIIDGITAATGVRPTVFSYGPTWKDKRADVPAVS